LLYLVGSSVLLYYSGSLNFTLVLSKPSLSGVLEFAAKTFKYFAFTITYNSNNNNNKSFLAKLISKVGTC